MSKCNWHGLLKKKLEKEKKTLLLLLILIVCLFMLTWEAITNFWNADLKDLSSDFRIKTSEFEATELSRCFELQGSELPELNEKEPKLGSCIFFHETSCPTDFSDISIRARQSCSIESALRAQPDTEVFLLISTPILRPLLETENVYVQQLLSYPNFNVRHITISKYLSNTPLYVIYTKGILNSSRWPVEHASDVLRYATLYKFGGIYLDLDVLVLKSLSDLKNFAAAETERSLGSCILGFGFDKIGREVARACARELARTYHPERWGFNGPGVITRVLTKRCGSTHTEDSVWYCKGFGIYPAKYFQAVSFQDRELLFEDGHYEEVLKMLNNSYTIHYWNKATSKFNLDNRLEIPYLMFAKKYCPKTYLAANGDFN